MDHRLSRRCPIFLPVGILTLAAPSGSPKAVCAIVYTAGQAQIKFSDCVAAAKVNAAASLQGLRLWSPCSCGGRGFYPEATPRENHDRADFLLTPSWSNLSSRLPNKRRGASNYNVPVAVIYGLRRSRSHRK